MPRYLSYGAGTPLTQAQQAQLMRLYALGAHDAARAVTVAQMITPGQPASAASYAAGGLCARELAIRVKRQGKPVRYYLTAAGVEEAKKHDAPPARALRVA